MYSTTTICMQAPYALFGQSKGINPHTVKPMGLGWPLRLSNLLASNKAGFHNPGHQNQATKHCHSYQIERVTHTAAT